ncbi:hypothetical protein R3I93_006360 [Phoxinus phoxinus]|uniref:Uncharacterized protein n=1 Tax=Phoxinus phoxinus TaxID=58324 RepID=A0AAN9CPH9_9TELE
MTTTSWIPDYVSISFRYPGRQMRAIQHRNTRDRVHLSAD